MIHKKELLEQINIYSLRNIAREIGVKAPSTLKKDVLINEILLIESGEKQPHVHSKKGRPVKSYVEKTLIGNDKKTIDFLTLNTEKELKRKIINSILKEIEKKLYKIL